MRYCINCGLEVTEPGSNLCNECGEAAENAWYGLEEIGDIVREKAEEKNLKLYDLEKMTGLQGITIKKVLSGQTYNILTLLKLLHALDLCLRLEKK